MGEHFFEVQEGDASRIGRVALFCAKVGSSSCPCTDRFNWVDVCGFLEPPESDRQWKVRFHGAFSFPCDVLGLHPNDQSCHNEAWLHLEFVEWRDVQLQREKFCQRILLKERSSPYRYGKESGRISDSMSDHSLSS